ncbi:MAG TPA: DUF1801 domain-containing protein [Gaiellaceae bacterium]|jgi:uncharacterized protein YdhG (YjbR/CyaY superfamily)|nr:DUF1801 domain-containing protein [Gaiellaceae bacterium]
MTNYEAGDVDGYIAHADAAARPHLEELRALVRSAIPDAEEGISWGVPFYKHHGPVGGFAAFKRHVSFGLNEQLSPRDREKLEARGYKTGKKTVQIAFEQAVPTATLERMLKAQAKANEAARRPK